MPNIFDYTDLRAFLQDAFDETKQKNSRWSLRSWAMKLRLSGPSGLAMVLKGQRNVGGKLAVRLIAYFKFTDAEAEYFSGLAKLSPGSQSATLISILKAETEAKSKPAAKHPSKDIDLAFRWYFYAIREMTLLAGFEPTPEWIFKRLRRNVSTSQIRATLDALVRMGFLARDPSGRFQPAAGKFDAGPGTEELGKRYQSEILELGRHALENDPADVRGFFSSTFTISQSDMPAAKEAIRQFRIDFEKKFERAGGDSTVQLNLQLFPVASINQRD